MVCGMKVVTHGSVLVVDFLCQRGHDSKWSINSIADSDLFLSAGILFSGNTLEHIKEMMTIANINFIGHSLFTNYRKIFFISRHPLSIQNISILRHI